MRVFNAIFSVPPEYIFIKVVHIQNGKLFLKNLLHNTKKYLIPVSPSVLFSPFVSQELDVRVTFLSQLCAPD